MTTDRELWLDRRAHALRTAVTRNTNDGLGPRDKLLGASCRLNMANVREEATLEP